MIWFTSLPPEELIRQQYPPHKWYISTLAAVSQHSLQISSTAWSMQLRAIHDHACNARNARNKITNKAIKQTMQLNFPEPVTIYIYKLRSFANVYRLSCYNTTIALQQFYWSNCAATHVLTQLWLVSMLAANKIQIIPFNQIILIIVPIFFLFVIVSQMLFKEQWVNTAQCTVWTTQSFLPEQCIECTQCSLKNICVSFTLGWNGEEVGIPAWNNFLQPLVSHIRFCQCSVLPAIRNSIGSQLSDCLLKCNNFTSLFQYHVTTTK